MVCLWGQNQHQPLISVYYVCMYSGSIVAWTLLIYVIMYQIFLKPPVCLNYKKN